MAMFKRVARSLALVATVAAIATTTGTAAPAAAADSAESIYSRALGRERELRDDISGATLGQLRAVVRRYETVVERFPRSGYCDNALWQGGNLAMLIFERYDKVEDRQTAVRLLKLLRDGYPSSPFRARAARQLADLDSSRPAPAGASSSSSSASHAAVPPLSGQLIVPETIAPKSADLPLPPPLPPSPPPAVTSTIATIKEIKRLPLPDGVRVSIELDAEAFYRQERLENPRRVFFDLQAARTTAALQDAVLKFDDDVVREIRLGRHPRSTTRIVMDMESVEAYSVFTLYNPFRLVVDFKRAASAARPTAPVATGLTASVPGTEASVVVPPPVEAKPIAAAKEPVPLLSRPAAAPAAVSPTSPTANSNGQFSLARQLGLGVSRIVLDAGHGGHDPGARGSGINEADLVLDVTLRLRDLLEKQPGIEVTLTRGTDEFVQLEERTAMANRTGADLFLSIHANASRNPQARGVETYFLNFASNPEAEAVAARENSASGKTMHSLPEIVRAIALNNKIDESRDFADMVQKSMVRRLSAKNKTLRDLGVKQAPFVVLIGAGMPSVLAEISFVTNRQDGALLKTGAYRQQIAESLFDAILSYQRSLKGVRAVASAKEE
jgi:N-acetylmuramoyl-L-alanine amidase